MDSDSSHPIAVTVEADAWHTAVADPASTARWAVEAALAATGETAGGVSVLLADDAAVRELNRLWRGQDKPTNVLSFPARVPGEPWPPDEPRVLGDIAVALETLLREAAAEARPASHHLAHLLVHGTLHLCGHDHEEEAAADVMEALEVKVLAGLDIPDPYKDGPDPYEDGIER